MNELGISLLWCAIQVTVLGLAVGGCYLLVRRFNSAAAALVAFTGLLLVAGLSATAFSPWPRWVSLDAQPAEDSLASANAGETISVSSTSEETTAATAAEEAFSAGDDLSPAPATAQAEDDSPSFATLLWNAFREELRTPAPAAERSSSWRLSGVAAVLVLAGIVFGLVRLFGGWWAVRLYRRRSIPVRQPALLELVDVLAAELGCRRPVEVRETAELATAATVGWQLPLILLPSEWTRWSQPERRAVLAHELAHIRRNDFLAWVCAQVGVVLHFYHPLVHWLAGRLRLEQELAADTAAAALSGGRQRYLETLAGMALRQAERPVGWPAQTFLPTRRTFLRRIEMLKNTKQLAGITLSRSLRVATVGVLVLAGFVAAGLRHPADPLSRSAEAQEVALRQPVEQESRESTEAKPFDLSWVPVESGMVFALRPAALLSRPEFRRLAEGFDQDLEFQKQLGFSVSRLEQVTVVFVKPPGERPNPAFILRTGESTDFRQLVDRQLRGKGQRAEYRGKSYYTKPTDTPGRADDSCFTPDDHTFVYAESRAVMHSVIDAGKNGAADASWSELWKEVENEQAAGLVNLGVMQQELQRALEHAPPGHPLTAIAPLYQNSQRIACGVNIDKQLNLRMIADCENAEDAATVKETLQSAVTLGRNMLAGLQQQIERRPPPDSERLLVQTAVKTAEAVLENVKIEQSDSRVQLTAAAGGDMVALLGGALVQPVKRAREAARAAQAKNNLRQIAIAFHNYHDTHKHLPPAVVMGPDGKTPHSWRVALLPYLDQEALYRQYNLNQPWDSPDNKRVLEKMPAVFRNLHQEAGSTNAAYFALTGEGTVFSGKEGTRFKEIVDGASNTLLVVEAKREIPWTKPEDIPYDPEKEFPKLGGFYEGAFHAAFCDGRVRLFPKDSDVIIFRAMITKNGREALRSLD